MPILLPSFLVPHFRSYTCQSYFLVSELIFSKLSHFISAQTIDPNLARERKSVLTAQREMDGGCLNSLVVSIYNKQLVIDRKGDILLYQHLC